MKLAKRLQLAKVRCDYYAQRVLVGADACPKLVPVTSHLSFFSSTLSFIFASSRYVDSLGVISVNEETQNRYFEALSLG